MASPQMIGEEQTLFAACVTSPHLRWVTDFTLVVVAQHYGPLQDRKWKNPWGHIAINHSLWLDSCLNRSSVVSMRVAAATLGDDCMYLTGCSGICCVRRSR